MKKIYWNKMLKQFGIRGKKWNFVVSFRENWKFAGFVAGQGFGRYVGITF